jgi:hypothetical protein
LSEARYNLFQIHGVVSEDWDKINIPYSGYWNQIQTLRHGMTPREVSNHLNRYVKRKQKYFPKNVLPDERINVNVLTNIELNTLIKILELVEN